MHRAMSTEYMYSRLNGQTARVVELFPSAFEDEVVINAKHIDLCDADGPSFHTLSYSW